MKHIFSLLLLSILVISCGDKEEDEVLRTGIEGNWTLIEMLLDPGDGSGVFMPTTLNVDIEVFADGSVEGNGMLCGMSQSTNGQVQMAQFSEQDSLFTSNCDSIPLSLGVDHMEDILILRYPCIEPCLAKFEKQ